MTKIPAYFLNFLLIEIEKMFLFLQLFNYPSKMFNITAVIYLYKKIFSIHAKASI